MICASVLLVVAHFSTWKYFHHHNGWVISWQPCSTLAFWPYYRRHTWYRNFIFFYKLSLFSLPMRSLYKENAERLQKFLAISSFLQPLCALYSDYELHMDSTQYLISLILACSLSSAVRILFTTLTKLMFAKKSLTSLNLHQKCLNWMSQLT